MRRCEICVFDPYFEALEPHRAALQSWLERLLERGPGLTASQRPGDNPGIQ
jgi:hypothetical protein